MQSLANYIKIGFSVSATVLTIILGGWDMALSVLIILIAADYLTGLCKAFCFGGLSSCIGAKGIAKKVMLLVVVAVAAQLDRLINTELIRTAVIYFYVANEGLSILENLTSIGVPFPKQLTDKLIQLKGDGNEK